MKRIIFISLLLVFVFGMLVACNNPNLGPNPNDTESTQNDNDATTITTTTITYEGDTLVDAIVDYPYTGSVAKATGSKGITYEIKEGSKLPDGMVLSKAGRLSGTPTVTGDYEFRILQIWMYI